ncbi:MAG: 4-diphosphocytidyl-2-C-methyl-D-erythritol kinase, partial [Pseudomonadota bacterium]
MLTTATTPRYLHDCPAPAKLNLFLHVVGRRDDGYHLLQSVFQLIDLQDTLHFDLRDDERIVRVTDLADVPEADDLVIRAAKLLKAAANSRGKTICGVDIGLEKRIPMGGGLGGGSS